MSPRPSPDSDVHGRCALCGRKPVALTRHHLIPRARHRRGRTRRQFDRETLEGHVLWVCRPCHNHIHRCLSEQELAERWNTRDALLAHPAIHRFATWLASKPPGFRPKSPGRRR